MRNDDIWFDHYQRIRWITTLSFIAGLAIGVAWSGVVVYLSTRDDAACHAR